MEQDAFLMVSWDHGLEVCQGKKLEIWDEDTWAQSQEEWVAAVQADEGELPAALEDLSL